MRVCRIDERTVAITELDPFSCELLKRISSSAAAEEDSLAAARFYSPPTGGSEPGIDEDWRAYVEPELRQLFQSSMEVVLEDLANFPPEAEPPPFTLSLPVVHLQSWINALNQARLALAAEHSVTEADMDGFPLEGDARALALFQIHYYGFLQECFLREVDSL